MNDVIIFCSGQKIREENQNKDDDHYVHKTTKIPNSTKKLMNIVSKLKKENDERYNQKNDSIEISKDVCNRNQRRIVIHVYSITLFLHNFHI